MYKFLGENDCKVDAKGRFRLPSAFLRQLEGEEEEFVLNRGFEECLILYPRKVWDEIIETEIEPLDDYDEEAREFRREFLAGARDVKLDSSERINIPKRLMDYADINKEIVLLGIGKKIEIWDLKAYDAKYNVSRKGNSMAKLSQRVMANRKKKANDELS